MDYKNKFRFFIHFLLLSQKCGINSLRANSGIPVIGTTKSGVGPFITKLKEESYIAKFIYDLVGEWGVTTGRRRDLGWIDVNAIRAAVNAIGCRHICMNCMDVIGLIPGGKAKLCYAYKHKETGEITYNIETL